MKMRDNCLIVHPFVSIFYSAYLLMWASFFKLAMNQPVIPGGSGGKCATGLVIVLALMFIISGLYFFTTLIQCFFSKEKRLYKNLALLILFPIAAVAIWVLI